MENLELIDIHSHSNISPDAVDTPEEMLSLAEWGKFSIPAHMTFLLRFTGVDAPNGLVTDKTERSRAAFETHKPIINKILQTIISKEIALEANSSGIGTVSEVPCQARNF